MIIYCDFFVHYSLYFINTNWVKKMLDFVIFAATTIIGLLILFFSLKDSGKEVWQGIANTTRNQFLKFLPYYWLCIFQVAW